jgi:hypothetical protein
MVVRAAHSTRYRLLYRVIRRVRKGYILESHFAKKTTLAIKIVGNEYSPGSGLHKH